LEGDRSREEPRRQGPEPAARFRPGAPSRATGCPIPDPGGRGGRGCGTTRADGARRTTRRPPDIGPQLQTESWPERFLLGGGGWEGAKRRRSGSIQMGDSAARLNCTRRLESRKARTEVSTAEDKRAHGPERRVLSAGRDDRGTDVAISTAADSRIGSKHRTRGRRARWHGPCVPERHGSHHRSRPEVRTVEGSARLHACLGHARWRVLELAMSDRLRHRCSTRCRPRHLVAPLASERSNLTMF
jgi:hypothetical protein